MNTLRFLREKSGISQSELAVKLDVSRQTIINYENNDNKITTENLKKLSKIFRVPCGYILGEEDIDNYEYEIIPSEKEKKETDMRISIPENNIEKFKQVFLYIIQKIGAKPNVGQTVLYKLLYFIDFDFYELNEKQLMGLKYIKNTYGPTPVSFAKVMKVMEKDKELEEVKTKFFDKDMTKYIPIKSPKLSLLSGEELKHIDAVLDKYSDMTAKELSDLSHKDTPWIIAEEKGIIDYEAVFYRTPETSVRKYEYDND